MVAGEGAPSPSQAASIHPAARHSTELQAATPLAPPSRSVVVVIGEHHLGAGVKLFKESGFMSISRFG